MVNFRRVIKCASLLNRNLAAAGAVALLGMPLISPGIARAAADTFVGVGPRARVDVSRLPAPGTYRLPRIMAAPEAVVLDTAGRQVRMHGLLRGRLSVVSFIYSYCRDPEGCPRAWAVLDAVHVELLRDQKLAGQAQLVSVSFDPTNDTPEQMRLLSGDRAHWRFLTTASVSALLPLLRGFGQDVSVEVDAKGRATRTLNHMLKVFLVDESSQVREIYSVATLDPQAVVNDLRTLQLERLSAKR